MTKEKADWWSDVLLHLTDLPFVLASMEDVAKLGPIYHGISRIGLPEVVEESFTPYSAHHVDRGRGGFGILLTPNPYGNDVQYGVKLSTAKAEIKVFGDPEIVKTDQSWTLLIGLHAISPNPLELPPAIVFRWQRAYERQYETSPISILKADDQLIPA